jgi:transcription-repair coupling factor (superfamily II helicase)
VENRGEVAVRGSIVDVFPSTADVPVRIDLWGDEVDRLTEFSVADQRTTVDIAEVEIFPCRELLAGDEVRARAAKLVHREPWGRDVWEKLAEGLLFDGMESWLPWLVGEDVLLPDLLGADAQVLLVEPRRIRDRAADVVAEEHDLARSLSRTWGYDAGSSDAGSSDAGSSDAGSGDAGSGDEGSSEDEGPTGDDRPDEGAGRSGGNGPSGGNVPSGHDRGGDHGAGGRGGAHDIPALHLPFERLLARCDAPAWPVTAAPEGPDVAIVTAAGWPPVAGEGEALVRQLRQLLGDGYRVVLAADGAGSADRLAGLLAEYGLAFRRDGDLRRPGGHLVVQAVERGCILTHAKVAVLAEADLTGRRRAHRRARPRRRDTSGFFDDLKIGDHVVHHHHGVARYGGMVTRAIGGVERDYLLLEYRGGRQAVRPLRPDRRRPPLHRR